MVQGQLPNNFKFSLYFYIVYLKLKHEEKYGFKESK